MVALMPSPWRERVLAKRIDDCGRPTTEFVVKRLAAVAGELTPQVTLPDASEGAFALLQGPVPQGYVYLLGDALACEDSRLWGYVPADHVIALVVTPERKRRADIGGGG